MRFKHFKLVHIGLLVLAATAVTYPYLTKGLADGDDRQEHLEYQHFFNEQIARGELYPRWMPGLNSGHGSPAFFVFYPLPYYVAWGLGKVVPNHWGIYTETRSQGLGVVLATILGALFTYAWCSTFVDGWSATAASVLFITLPYLFSTDLYLRTSVGELWGLAIMPIAFYCVERKPASAGRFLAGLATAFALVLLSHLFTAVLLAPVVVAYAVWRSEPAKRFYAAWQTAAALALGTALAAVYTFPVFAHRNFLHPENLLAVFGASYSPLSQMFSYDVSMFPRDTAEWHVLSQFARGLGAAAVCLVGSSCYRSSREGSLHVSKICLAALSVATLVLTLLAGHLPGLGAIPGSAPLFSYFADQRAHIFLGTFLTLEVVLLCYWYLSRESRGGLADFLIAMALLSFLMMTRWSFVVWTAIRPLWSIQFPWRFNVFLLLAAVGLAALAISDIGKQPLRKRIVNGVLAVAVWAIVAGGVAHAGEVRDAFRKTETVTFDPKSVETLLPAYAQVKTRKEALDIVSSAKNEGQGAVVTSGSGQAVATIANPRLIELYATCETDCTLQIGQFYYPAWRAWLVQRGAQIPLRASTPGGLMELSLPRGESFVAVELPRDWSEWTGPWVSLASLILVLALALSDRFRRLARLSD